MSNKRHVEIFSAGCDLCHDLIEKVNEIACSSCEIDILDLTQEQHARKARSYGINSVPAVVVDGQPVTCCENSGPDEAKLRAAGIGSTS